MNLGRNYARKQLRMDARSEGRKEYDPKHPCVKGHISNRSTKTNCCLQCDKDRAEKRKQSKHRIGYERHRKYGLTTEQYEEMLKSQQDKCAICQTQFNYKKPLTGQSPKVDHCHNSGEVRAILCSLCNSMIGFAKDRPEILRVGAKYLELFTSNHDEKALLAPDSLHS